MSVVAELIRSGALVPVVVYGGETEGDSHAVPGKPGTTTCEHCGHDVPWGFGLADRFSTFTPGGSDCNRATFFLLRPNDFGPGETQDLDAIRAALDEVLDE